MSAGFRELVARCGVLSAVQIDALEAHFTLLQRWNKVINLTTVTDLEEAVERHYCESLFLAGRLPEAVSVADVGSGAGFPGYVVAVAKPDNSVALIESHQRKSVFLREASRGVTNVRVLGVRAESVAERFDWVISRAVSYADLAKVIPALGSQVAFLSGIEEPPTGWGEWERIPLPWGRNRYLRIGCFT